MTTLNVQFSDASKLTIVAYFACPQSDSAYPNLGTVESSDSRWTAFYSAVDGIATGLPAPTSA